MQLLNKKCLLFNTTCFLLVLFVQSFIALQTITLMFVNQRKLLVSLILWLENNMIKKNLLAFAMLAQKLFLLFTAVVSEKITGSNISCLNQNELFRNSSSEKLVTRFCLLGMYFHFNLCKKEDCSACKFQDIYICFLLWGSSCREEKNLFLQEHCRKNYNKFHGLFSLFFFFDQVRGRKSKFKQ